ncbi:MAG: FAD-dependent oxidoreductase, partial [Candidatus Bipolaricaulota bacterium]|nr:FAD-dependent oxidoreductase [Candidatus Bipolaricaulota bacterium]
MRPLPFATLLSWALRELSFRGSIYGIPREAFWDPDPAPLFASEMFGRALLTPIGPAAGPHTQLAQNIVSAWLCGGRFIELKTVQILDELQIPRPCIDAADEGYNVEWSQELRLPESAGEYVKAWVLVHLLHRALGFRGLVGTLFNMSVGYDLQGVTSAPLRAFMDRLADARDEIGELLAEARRVRPELGEVEVPPQVATSVTLSTMHGCPPHEIEAIARYLLLERRLPTFVKLNPTLLGKDEVRRILHGLGFREIEIPDRVFDHDLQWEDAVPMLRRLLALSREVGIPFGVKLSNTLAMANTRRVLPGDEVYMSGRSLYPITMALFRKVFQALDGDLPVSYSAGADSLNVATVLACGARPVTAATDLLKPGGYGRLRDWLEKLGAEMRKRGARSLDELARDREGNLARAAEEALRDPRYRKEFFPPGLPKTERRLPRFDCVAAPCVERCPIGQDVPEYAWAIAQGDWDRALAVVLRRNPLPGVLGYICTHVCEGRCTRNGYEGPVAIRLLKRAAFDRGREPELRPLPPTGHRAAVVGGGPAGLAAAYFLALSGIGVTVFEAGDAPGGMPALAPAFRIPQGVIDRDVERIRKLGVEFRLRSPWTEPPERLLEEGFDAVFVAVGLPADAALGIPGEEGPGVYGAVDFLRRVRRGALLAGGPRVAGVGGGNVAMDASRV